MTFVFRNNTIERFFSAEYQFSGYDDISYIPTDVDGYVWCYQVPFKYNTDKLSIEISSYFTKLQYIISQIGNKRIIIFNLGQNYIVNFNESDNKVNNEIVEFNQRIKQLSLERSNVFIVDINDFTSNYSSTELIDWKYYFMSQMPYNPRLSNAFKVWFSNKLRSIELKRKKCLVLDLDNTLWGGILGEDGIEGIQMSGDYPGKAYHLWQEGLLELKNQGVILAICSKNNENDVLDVWKNRTDIVLRQDDFVTYRINWLDKATNIRSIANELNIGLDSFVFIDDNPAERELIKQQLPEVVVPDWVNQPYELPILLKNIVDNYFSVYAVTEEDRQKTNQYKLKAEREELQLQFSNLDDFIKSLNIELSIEPINDVTIVRAAQMTQKTNQFNLTTKRYTESDIRLILSSGGFGWTLSVKDKFGDNGITGLCIVNSEGEFDTFLMSCRVLGKKIEDVFISEIFTKLADANKKQISAQYIPTLKNAQVSDFYDRNGFEVISKESDGTIYYQKDLADFVYSKNENYTII